MQEKEKNMKKMTKEEYKEVRNILGEMADKMIKKDMKMLKELAKY